MRSLYALVLGLACAACGSGTETATVGSSGLHTEDIEGHFTVKNDGSDILKAVAWLLVPRQTTDSRHEWIVLDGQDSLAIGGTPMQLSGRYYVADVPVSTGTDLAFRFQRAASEPSLDISVPPFPEAFSMTAPTSGAVLHTGAPVEFGWTGVLAPVFEFRVAGDCIDTIGDYPVGLRGDAGKHSTQALARRTGSSAESCKAVAAIRVYSAPPLALAVDGLAPWSSRESVQSRQVTVSVAP